MHRAAALLACALASGQAAARDGAAVPLTDIARLARTLNLPAMPQRVCFVETTLGDNRLGPADRQLSILVKFDDAALAPVLARTPKIAADHARFDGEIALPRQCWATLGLPPVVVRPGGGPDGAPSFVRRDAAAWLRSPYFDGVLFETAQPGLLIGRFHTR